MPIGNAIIADSKLKGWAKGSMNLKTQKKRRGEGKPISIGIVVRTGATYYGLPADAKERRM